MDNQQTLLKLKNVSKFYYNKGLVASGFSKVSLDFNLGEFVVITGESGSGKSTLLNVLSGLDTYEEGEMYINGEETSHYNESDFEEYRKTYIGNIFQSFNLVNSYTVYQNIELVLLLNGYKRINIKDKIIDLIKKVDLYKYRNTRVSHLSGGQKQRVAIARALAKDTPIILADEPTGNLDSKSAKSVIKLLSEIAKDKLVIIVTHNYEQVEEYATRKIEMHDGKVREDIALKEYVKADAIIKKYKNITLFNKLCLGIRNTFNIVPKFLLTFAVFLFVVLAFLNSYSGFRKLEYVEGKVGYNNYFQNTDDTRIVIKKKDGTSLSKENLMALRNLENVQKVEEDDALLDTSYELTYGDYYFDGVVESINNIDHVDVGRMPIEENEIVVKGNKYNYYLSESIDTLSERKLSLYTIYGNMVGYDKDLYIVGIIYTDDDYQFSFYVSNQVIERVRLSLNEQYSFEQIFLNDKTYKVNRYDNNMRIKPSKLVKDGEAVVSSDINYLCKYGWCRNNKMIVQISNIYYSDSKELVITNMYTKYNFKSLTGLDKYDENNGLIFISENDYNSLYNRYTFQSSVFANDVDNVDNLAVKLNKMGYTTLKIKDTLANDLEEVTRIIKIFKLIVTIVLFVVLFFIAYFVIKLIQKSKNVYYSIVRILGGSKKVVKNLITIELINVFHIAYLTFIIFIILIKKEIIQVSFLTDTAKYLKLNDFILIYVILMIMSYFLSQRYARKLFKSSAMRAYNEEV